MSDALDHLTLDDVSRFLGKVDRSGECWLWTASTTRSGYGKFRLGRATSGAIVTAPRLAYFIATDVNPGDRFVCHRCDNPACVRPEHLFLGTAKDNNSDCAAKGRRPRGRGHPNAKLTEESVRELRARVRAGETQEAVARGLGVTRGCVKEVLRGKTWRHVA